MHRPLHVIGALTLTLSLAFAASRGAWAHDAVDVSIAELTRGIASHPDSLPLYLLRAELRRIQGDYTGASEDLIQVERRDPAHRQLDLCRAALALDTGQPAAARRLLDAVLALRPSEPRALRLRSRALIALGARGEAIADLGAEIAALPRPRPDLYLERARLQVEEGDREGARRGLDEAHARLGTVASLELYAIELELAGGHPGAARARLERLRRQYPDPTALAGVSARIAAAGSGATTLLAGPALNVAEGADLGAAPGRALSSETARPGERASLLPPPLVTRGPYLQVCTAEAITVRWRTDSQSDSWVRYGTSPEALTSSASDAATTTEHEIRLTSLLPATRYYYSVGTSTDVLAGDASHTFVTAPVAGTAQTTRVWVLGDSGSPTSYAFAVRDAYAAWTGSRSTDLWLMLGDNAYGSGTDSEYQVAVFQQYPVMLRQSALWPTRGNHDDLHGGANNDYYDIFTMPAAGEAGGLSSGTEAYYAFDWANIHFICLDSEGSDRSPGGAMLTWLANDLAANTRPWVIAYWHHPPYSKGSHDSDDSSQLTDMRENALPILEAGGVDLVLSGHSHSYERSFLLDGHYGVSTTLTPAMVLDSGDGRADGDGPYTKPGAVHSPHAGAVYAVAGSSSKASGGSLNHPVMVASLDLWGSMVLDVDGDRLDARFLSHTGAVLDSCSIVKESPVGVNEGTARANGLQLGPGLPNPFTLDLRMSFALERAGHVRLGVHDAAGRRVATIEEGWREAGAHEARWDGRDALGRAMPNGVYHAVLEAHGARVSRKIAHVR
jgi:tetratricopeptide (TPR) repeat protein